MSNYKNNPDRKQNPRTSKKSPSYLEQINPYVAGIDIGSRSHFVAAPIAGDKKGDLEICVKEFSSFTPDLEALADWLKECQVTSVAMESTGVYWIPLYELLESRGFDVNLVDARHVKNVTGRKSDVQDCQWIQQLHACGLLAPAFRPEDKILPLRSYVRQRDILLTQAAICIQHMQKALTQMNLHLSNVLADITGLTGMTIIRAIVAGERDPKKLAQFRDPRCRQPIDVIEKSLTGHYRDEHLFSLKQALESYDFYQQQILACDQKIEQALINLNSGPIKPTSGDDPQPLSCKPRTYKTKRGNALYFNPLSHLHSILGTDVTNIPGIEANLAVKILGEIGMDMTKWRSEKHFTSWLGLSPNNKVSGGRRLSSRTMPSANRTANHFRMAACALSRSQTALGGFLRRMKAKLGAPKAITATARKIAVIFYSMLTRGTEYVEAGLDYYEKQYKERLLKGLQKKAAQLGYKVTPLTQAEGTSL
jgi:transposase